MEEIKNDIGVIIGRFQIDNLHSEHVKLIQSVLDKHKKVVLFLGTSIALGTCKNPLDFITRKVMIESFFSNKISAILPLPDQKSNDVWSGSITSKIREVFPHGSVTLYGSKDSFIPYYSGPFATCELEPDIYISATNIREKVSKEILKSPEFRTGIIYSVYNQYPIMHSTIDVLIKRSNGDILLGRKPNELNWRFIGGFVDPTDIDEIFACKREVLEESGLEVDDFKFICSMKIDDWRYRGIKERGIMTHFYECKYIFGNPQPMDDIAELKWVTPTENTPDILVGGHKELYNKWFKKE